MMRAVSAVPSSTNGCSARRSSDVALASATSTRGTPAAMSELKSLTAVRKHATMALIGRRMHGACSNTEFQTPSVEAGL